jgi:hypothetical protein
MAFVFLEGGLAPIPVRMASTKPIVDPAAMHVNLRIVERTNARVRKRNSLMNLDFF